MKHLFQIGDQKRISKCVTEADLAAFETGVVHPFYGTFALGRDVEWACRQFVLEAKEEHEEGIGTFLNIEHRSPALLGDAVEIVATLQSWEGHSLVCAYQVYVGDRLIAEGTQGQKILSKEKLARLTESLHGR
ncbi:MAG: thioesterase family protein [Bacteroidia bacterium]